MDNKGNQNKNGKNPRGQNYAVLIMTMLFTLLCVAMMHNLWQGSRTHKMPYSEFNQMLKDHEVESVVIGNGKIQITPKEDSKKYGGSQGKYGNLVGMEYYTIPINDPDLEKKLDEAGVTTYEQAEVDATGSIIMLLLEWVLPIAAMFVIFNMMMKRMGGGGGIMGVGKSNAKVYVQKETGVTFKDVAGEDEAKESLTEIVDFLHNPGKYTKIGAKLPKGALLVGPPGTGKTLLAKAVAGEAKVPFFSLSGSDFVEMFVGVGASRVRDLFKQAQQSAPCIIFIDEIDAIGKSRDSRYGGGNDEREQTLNQLLAEMDGFDPSKGVFILAATNRPDVLDKALLRPGRFDRRIIVDKPDLKGRVNILKVHSKDVLMDDTVDLEAIALATAGAVGSDLANMINEAAINAVKNGRGVVSQKDLFESVEVVIAGKEKKDRLLSPQEKKIVSYHEVGHALVTALSKNAEPVQKITIVPRTMGSLGYTMQVPEEEKYLMSKEELMTRVYTLLGGRAAEEIVFNSVTTGASNDIERATKLVRNMITLYGMSDRFGLMGLETVENQYLDGRTVLNCSDRTAAEVDDEVKVVLKDAYGKVKEMLAQNREVLDKVADFLIEKETITGKEFMEIFNEVKGIKPESDGSTPDGIKEAAAQEQPESIEQHEDSAAQPENGAEHPVEAQNVIADETAEAHTAQPDNEDADKGAAGSDNQN